MSTPRQAKDAERCIQLHFPVAEHALKLMLACKIPCAFYWRMIACICSVFALAPISSLGILTMRRDRMEFAG